MQQHNKDRSGLIEQENEVEMVKKEIDLLDEGRTIFMKMPRYLNLMDLSSFLKSSKKPRRL